MPLLVKKRNFDLMLGNFVQHKIVVVSNFCVSVVLHVNVTCTAHQIYLEMCNILKINLKHVRFTFSIQPFTRQFSAVVRMLLNLNDYCETLSSQSDRNVYFIFEFPRIISL